MNNMEYSMNDSFQFKAPAAEPRIFSHVSEYIVYFAAFFSILLCLSCDWRCWVCLVSLVFKSVKCAQKYISVNRKLVYTNKRVS